MTRRLVYGYLAALALSGGWRAVHRRPFHMAWTDTAPGRGELPCVLLIHGSPGDGSSMQPLAHLLPPRYRVLVPDLPGFGESSGALPDYSFLAHARYLLAWLDGLGIARVHAVAFSMGGGVALSMADLAPGRVASLTMISAIGAQEYELTGSYRVNHLMHGAQLAVLWAAREVLPHFGWLDRFPFNVAYARNFYDSDQRPLRGVLGRYRGPMLIVHGDRDLLVPVAAAREHHRLVPQSRLVIFHGNHFAAFMQPEVIAKPLLEFLP